MLFCDSGARQSGGPPSVPTRSTGLIRPSWEEAKQVQWAPVAAEGEPVGPHSLWGELTARQCGPLLPSWS